MADINITDFLGSWAGAINKEIKKTLLPTDPRILNDPNGEYLVSYLPFDKSVSEDLCGNIWEVSGNPTISDGVLSVNNSDKKGSLTMPSFTLGGQDFAISFWAKIEKTTPTSSLVFALGYTTSNSSKVVIQRDSSIYYNICNLKAYDASGNMTIVDTTIDGTWAYFEINYAPSSGQGLQLYHNGKAKLGAGEIPRQNFRIRLCDNSGEHGTFIGCIDEFKIYDGVALHTANFTPPTRT